MKSVSVPCLSKCTKQHGIHNHLLPLIISPEPCIRMKSKSLNAPTRIARAKFYTALPVSVVVSYFRSKSLLSYVQYMVLLYQTEPIDWVLWGSLWSVIMPVSTCLFTVFLAGCDQLSRSQPLAVASILWFRIGKPEASLA